ncbi:hypothetical protein [Streptomyces sp. DSM 15324]|uniref:hypothetical protein n=1 Tax=Streptomyces sp. DSM 15324 TaxID=1739111 RepID=UPI000746407B|nr:hypothetical protein [Streptomyces sp. DSM 15324]KUO12681.1 hypothetical protein AQJ58_07775 [Streptomyces sp. DSM 15324]
MNRKLRRTLASAACALALAAGTLLGTAATAHADGHGSGWYGVWAANVNIRTGGEWCQIAPSVDRCPNVQAQVGAPRAVFVYCQVEGDQVVGGNPYWVWVATTDNTRGYMASYYLNNRTDWIDGLPLC